MNKPELISFSEPLMVDYKFDQRTLFAPEIENIKNGLDGLMASGLINSESKNDLVEYHENVAVLKIDGPLRPGNDWYFSTGYGDIQNAILQLIGNDEIKTVIQLIDSPGGTVKQAFETEEMFRELAKEKNLIALVTGSATSAAALMTFPASKRYLASKTAQTGSIGVVAEHVDNRVWYQEYLGEVRTSVAKGDYKDAGTDTRGYDSKAKEIFESAVSDLYDIFAESAAVGLGITREKIDAMQSRVFIGQEGINQGFADGFATLNELIEQSQNERVFPTPERPAFSTHTQENKRMDINQLKAEHPDVYQAAVALGKAEGSEASKETHQAEGTAAGVLLERKRMNDIDALGLPADFAKSAKESDMSAEQTASSYLIAEAAKKKEVAAGMESDIPKPLASDTPADVTEPEGDVKDPEKDFKAAVDVKTAAGMKRTDAIKAVAKESPELHQSYVEAINGGKK